MRIPGNITWVVGAVALLGFPDRLAQGVQGRRVEHRYDLLDLPLPCPELAARHPELDLGWDDPRLLSRTLLERLSRYGQFVSKEPGDPVDLSALRYPIEPRIARLLNPHPEALFDIILCCSYYHRALPGESLGDLASLYHCDPSTLRALNDLSAEQQPEAWSKVLVPPSIGPSKRSGPLCLRQPIPRWSKLAANRSWLRFEHAPRLHSVLEGEGWQSIAGQYDIRPDILQQLNRKQTWGQGSDAGAVPEGVEPPVGRHLFVGLELFVDDRSDLEVTVLYLEHFLRVDLDRVLLLNSINCAEELVGLRVIYLPFNTLQGFSGLRFGGGESFSTAEDSRSTSTLGVGDRDGRRTFDVTLVGRGE